MKDMLREFDSAKEISCTLWNSKERIIFIYPRSPLDPALSTLFSPWNSFLFQYTLAVTSLKKIPVL